MSYEHPRPYPPQQPSGPFIQPQVYPPVPVQQVQNGYGVTAFVLGLLSALFGWIPIIGAGAWITAPLAVGFGIAGLKRVGAGRANNKSLTIAGIVLAGIALAFCLVYVAAIGKNAQPVSSVPATGPRITTSAPTRIAPIPNVAPAPAVDVQTGEFTDGVYEVGTEIPAGKYSTDGVGGSGFMGCYWAKSRDGSSETLTDNDIGKGPRKVTLKDGYIEFSGGCTWTKS